MRQFLLGLYFLCFLNVASGQEIPLPENMPQEHPRADYAGGKAGNMESD